MRKVVSDEEFKELESDKKHEELVALLKAIVQKDGTPELKASLDRQSVQLASLLKKDFAAELKPLIKELIGKIDDLKAALNKPKSNPTFRVHRGETGLIERVSVERGN